MTSTAAHRRPTPIDAIADAYVRRTAELDPLSATAMGIDGFDHLMTDYSPAGWQAQADAARDVLAQLDGAEPVDDVDRVTLAAMRERVGLMLELVDAGEVLGHLNNIASPVQGVRDVFAVMATSTPEHWAAIAARLLAVPTATAGIAESLRLAAGQGHVAAARQVQACIDQCRDLAGDESMFTTLVQGPAAQAALGLGHQQVRDDLERGARAAREAYGELATMLQEELLPRAPQADGVGRERYALWSRYFLGATVDLEETYAWGLAELERVVTEQEEVAALVAGPGASVEDAVAVLDADPARVLEGTEALQAWMQRTSDAAIAALDGVHFDIPDPLRTLECCIAPTRTGGIYYTGPSDDFTRPGRMWWSVPPEVTSFTTWREKTTVYHEGVPGHHLQVGQAVHERASLNSWRRLACWVSGHGEGWALYAERLMSDLGHLEDPGDRLGMLDGQRMRAARVVLDIGVHLGLPCPERWGGGTWDADKAWEFLKANVSMPEGFLRFELTRYLGWPGQAPAYKVGQRLWEQARDEARAAAHARGEELDLKEFHARALALGSVGLDVLRDALATG
ncbi:DUF885 domain-containing protein [Cellulomonas bogoriensis]|uniref:DUF885 domain-containing protein n=1 Tax=Cellulomonas bogoriensis 69B4 = DSM 16987 TaxID=1386082 RepID=A0A0A0BL12_9CELL|nr:DUF885 domain-containing protein [Cellulomonas bogoriensis]KGM08565.1 hypothetical protein N869_07675 [Cellulomonas bogoriensis 69B4 = DSM 16987]